MWPVVLKLKVTFPLARAPTAQAPDPVFRLFWIQGFPLLISALLLKPCFHFCTPYLGILWLEVFQILLRDIATNDSSCHSEFRSPQRAFSL